MKYARALATGLGLTLACAFAQEADAAALKQGECKPFAEMITALKAEGQRHLISADKVTESAQSTPLYMVTSNDNGEGYELVGDRKAGVTEPKNFCVRAVLEGIRLNGEIPSVPDAFLVPSSRTEQQIKEISERENIGGGIDHNTLLIGRAKHGVVPVLQARIVLEDGERGPRLTVLMDTRDNLIGSSNRSWEDGFSTGYDVLSKVGFSDYAKDIIRTGGPLMASLQP